ncbi:hypothetical protein [Methylobacterium pseudosasicola]|uniref:Uncharacterized protein n=1 Tax=Methylobacterium pseudosasicola TaxID=582667 RepID=A0A1I4L5E1_9HYPH|nr:hypothetical protein [Methylobacterium pseudosasicola]SFL86089.1 hypothetical protein SAMN05192568_1012125 [Methylobacterium pseudosasicola]
MSDVADAELFGNDDWSVNADGLEHRTTGYFISRNALSAKRAEGLWDWPLQMAEKSWCRPSLFRDAFLNALELFGIARDAGLTRSFALGYGIRAAEAPASDSFVTLADVLKPRALPETVRVAAPRPARAFAAAGA